MSEAEKMQRSKQKLPRLSSQPNRPADAPAGPLDLDACPPGHDPLIWDLVLTFRWAALELGDQQQAGNRLAYALLEQRIRESRVRSVLEATQPEVIINAPGDHPVWVKVIRRMMIAFFTDYVTIGREQYGFQQFTDVDTWQECLDVVLYQFMLAGVVQRDPEDPSKPREAATRKVNHSARPKPQSVPAHEWKYNEPRGGKLKGLKRAGH